MHDPNSGHKKRLIQRYAENTASEKEIKSLFGMLNTNEMDAFIEDDMDREIASMSKINEQQIPKRNISWYKYAAASVILILLSAIGSYVFFGRFTNKDMYTRVSNDILPGRNVAYLTLANGKRIELTNLANGSIVKEPGIHITKTSDGQLVYSLADIKGPKSANAFNIIETPRGGQYQVLLPDGSKVWLNAASSLKYPPSFAILKERKVELTGEAYFEVAKDKTKPFIVKTAQQEVEVLGTHFNINSYADEPNIKTTLLEGAVRVTYSVKDNNHAEEKREKVLKPGQQSVLTGTTINVREIETDDAVAWKNGQFVFTSENIIEIMRKVSRWYNVEVEYKENVSDKRFTGTVSRYSNVSEVLQTLELTNKLRFKLEGHKITITNN